MNQPIPFHRAKRQRRTPIERLAAIMPTLIWDAEKALGKSPVCLTPSGRVITTLADYVGIVVAPAMGVSGRSLWRWRKLFLESGGNLEALRDPCRSDKGSSRAFSGRSSAVSIICSLHHQRQTVRAIYIAITEAWSDLYPGTRAPSQATVRHFIQSLFGSTTLRAPKVPS